MTNPNSRKPPKTTNINTTYTTTESFEEVGEPIAVERKKDAHEINDRCTDEEQDGIADKHHQPKHQDVEEELVVFPENVDDQDSEYFEFMPDPELPATVKRSVWPLLEYLPSK
jgi:hypothetical protein